MKVAPSSMERVPAEISPSRMAFALSSQRSVTVMLPWTLPNTTTDLVFTSPLTKAFSPMVRAPSEVTSPSILPSMIKSLENLSDPLISTSLLRMFLLELMIRAVAEAGGVGMDGVVDTGR